MPEVLRPDLCIIGAGPAGMQAAMGAARSGASVVLIERGATGGAVLNAGGLASKALLAAGKIAHAQAHGRFSIKDGRGKTEFLNAHAHVRDVLRGAAPDMARERLGGLGVKLIAGVATFKDKQTVAVGNAYEVAARRFVIATGASAVPPEIPGLADVPHYTSETIFDLIHCPQHLIIIGGGDYALELAQAHRRFGAEVTILQAGPVLQWADPECAAIVMDQMVQERIAIRDEVTILRVERNRPRLRVILAGTDGGEEEVEGSHLLVLGASQANMADLDLAAAGIRHDASGIAVNKRLRTSNSKVYAIGDVVAGAIHSLRHATHDADLIVRSLVRRESVSRERTPIPRVIFTDPELAQVGIDEAALRQAKRSFRCLRSGFHHNDRARAQDAGQGHIKVITDRKGRILGVTIVGEQASETIAPWTLALAENMDIRAMQRLVVAYPTLAESGKRAAMSYDDGAGKSSSLSRFFGFLRRFG